MIASGSGSSSCITALLADTAPCTITVLLITKINTAEPVLRTTVFNIIRDVTTTPVGMRKATILAERKKTGVDADTPPKISKALLWQESLVWTF